MSKKYLFLILTFVFILYGCQVKEIQLSENAQIAKSYLEQNAYQVISFEGENWLEFTESDLNKLPDQQYWAVQYIKPDNYLNRRIDTVTFTIKNHPLDNEYNMGKTRITVWLVGNEIIGGWSLPISKSNDIVGGVYSLDGRTEEEVSKINHN